MKKTWIFVWVLIIGLTLSFGYYFFKSYTDSKIVYPVENTDFSLNDIAYSFNHVKYVKKQHWHASTKDNVITINKFKFKYTDNSLVMETNNESAKDIIPYLIDVIETYHGSNEGDYLDTGAKFVEGGVFLNGLDYKVDGKKYTITIDLLNTIEKYTIPKEITTETYTEINDVNYEFVYKYKNEKFKEMKYTINNISLKYTDILNNYTFTGILANYEMDYDLNLTIKFYDKDKKEILSSTQNMNDYETYDYPYVPFSFCVDLGNIKAQDIVYYSVKLEK